MYQSKCRDCGAPIFFAFTIEGKSIPLDERPIHFVESETGEVAYRVILGRAIKIKGYDVHSPGPKSCMAYKCHMATCEYRLRGKKTEAQFRAEVESYRMRRLEKERREAEKKNEPEAKTPELEFQQLSIWK